MANTANRSYPKPVSSHNVADDLAPLQTAFDMIDADIAAALVSLAGKAATAHSHQMVDVLGLSTALAGKSDVSHSHTLESLIDVSGVDAAPDGYVLAKVGGAWVPISKASAMVGHTHATSDITGLDAALAGRLTIADLAALSAKAAPVDADGYVLIDSADGNLPKLVPHASLKTVLKTYFDSLYTAAGVSSVPTGTILDFGGSVAPSGYLLCDGSVVSQTTEAALYTAIGTFWNTGGEGAGNFRLPDLRGRVTLGKGDMGGAGANRLGASLSGTRASTSNGVISGLSSTAGLAVGMAAFGTGIGTGAVISTIDSSTQVTLSANNTATGTATVRFAVIDDQTLGAVGGAAAHALITKQLPAHSHKIDSGGNNYYLMKSSGGAVGLTSGSGYASLMSSVQNEGGDQAHPNVQPSAIVNKIIKR